MLREPQINEVLGNLENNDKKLEFLDDIQENLIKLLELDAISQEDYDEIYSYTFEKAKKILKVGHKK